VPGRTAGGDYGAIPAEAPENIRKKKRKRGERRVLAGFCLWKKPVAGFHAAWRVDFFSNILHSPFLFGSETA